MNRDDKGKALHAYLSGGTLGAAVRSGIGQKPWASLKEDVKEEYRRVGQELAQDYMYGGKYELSLAPLDDEQILYNGLFTCTVSHECYGWCHLLLLRSKDRETDNEEEVEKLAIVSQSPNSLLAV